MFELPKNLNQEQKEAIIHDSGPLLIVAGAGTGKTTVITEKISYLINSGKCSANEVLALTFTDKAAQELEERVDKLLPYGYFDLWLCTFHSFAERLLKAHGLDIGLPNDFKLLNTTEQWLLVRQNLDKFDLNYYRPLGNPTKFIHALIRNFSRAKDENITPQDYLNYAEDLKLNADSSDFIKGFIAEENIKKLSKSELKEVLAEEIEKQLEIANAYHVYQKLLLDNNALDFGDLINYCLKLFRTRKGILLHYRQQFKYILVDEFQDTNYAQYELIKILAAPNNNVTVVGDDDQAIYKFRGASISNIMQFKDDYPHSKEIFLTSNYRSHQNILDLSYSFIQKNNPDRLEIKLAGENGFSKKLKTSLKGKGEIKHLHGRDLAEEVLSVTNKIIDLYNQGPEIKWSDFAILVRANSSADDFCLALEKAGVPYNFIASKGLYNKKIVMDILAYLKLLDDYHESPAMYRILSLPMWQLDNHELVNLNYWANRRGWSLYEVCRQINIFDNISQPTMEKVGKIISLVGRHAQLATDHKKASEIIQNFLDESSYLKSLTGIDSEYNKEQLNYLNQFFKKVLEFEKNDPDTSVKNFMNFIELELESGEEGTLSQNLEESSPDTVKVMTVHAAKGLEFSYVFIVNLVDKRFPSINRSEPIELPAKLVKEIIPVGDIHLQEERRLFYVAMTRAKQGLYLSSASDYGGSRHKKPSQFLMELSEFGLPIVPDALTADKDKTTSTALKIKDKKRSSVKTIGSAGNRFSFTQLKAFENCPYQYRFAHILKIPVKGKPAFSFGKTMHATLQKFFLMIGEGSKSKQKNLFGEEESGRTPTWEDLKKIYQESFIDDWYPNKTVKQEYFDKGLRSLKLFYEKYLADKPVAEYLELPFSLRVDSNNYIKGVMDRVDATAGGYKIIDYKTGEGKEKLTSEDKEQLLIYQLALTELMGKEVRELSFYYLEPGREISFIGTEKDLDRLKEKIIATIDEIKAGQFPPKPGRLCQYCDFNYICDFRA